MTIAGGSDFALAHMIHSVSNYLAVMWLAVGRIDHLPSPILITKCDEALAGTIVIYRGVAALSTAVFQCDRAVRRREKCNSTITLNIAAKKHHTEMNHVA